MDDYVHIVNNRQITEHTFSDIINQFRTAMFPGDLYRPLVTISYTITHYFFELAPWAYHLTNVIIHALNCVLVLWILSFLFDFRLAFFTSALFAVHPIHVEAVANISGRSELLCNYFGLLCIAYVLELSVKREKWESPPLLLSPFTLTILFLFALLSKESAFVYVLLIPLCLFFKHGLRRGYRESLSLVLPLFFASAIYLYLRTMALGGIFNPSVAPLLLDNPLISAGVFERALNAIVLLGKYIELILLPAILSSDYSYAKLDLIHNWLSPLVLIQLITVIALALLTYLGFKRDKLYAFWGLFFFFSFAITSNIFIPIGTIFAERLAYLPSLAILGLLSTFIIKKGEGVAPEVLAFIFICFYSVKTFSYNKVWVDNYSLYAYEIVNSPQSAKVHFNYAMTLKNRDKFYEADYHIRNAVEIYPAYHDAWHGLSLIAVKKKSYNKAIFYLRKALEIDPENISSLNQLGSLLFNGGDTAGAEKTFNKILSINPNDIEGQIGILAILVRDNRFDEARKLYKKIQDQAPKHEGLLRFKPYIK